MFFLKSMIFKKKNYFKKHDFEEKIIFQKHDFETKIFRLVSFWNEIFTTCQISNQLFKNASDFEMNTLQYVRYWVYLFCSLPNFHALIIAGHVSVIF